MSLLRKSLTRIRKSGSGTKTVAEKLMVSEEVSSEWLTKAKKFKADRKWEKALENYRRYLLACPSDSHSHLQSAYCSLEIHQPGAAYESVRRSLYLDPSMLASFELFLDLAERLSASKSVRRSVTNKFGKSLEARSDRWLEGLAFAIPLGLTECLKTIANAGTSPASSIAKKSLEMDASSGSEGASAATSSAETFDNSLRVRLLLARGRISEASALLAKSKVDEVPRTALRITIKRLHRNGEIESALRLTALSLRFFPDDGWAKTKIANLEIARRETIAGKERINILERGYPWLTPPGLSATTQSVPGDAILYLLHNSLPYSSAGYATRSHGIIGGLRGEHWDARGVTRPGYPFDRPESKHEGDRVDSLDHVDGVPYHRLSTHSERMPKIPLVPFEELYANRLLTLAREVRPGIMHAASNYWNGIAGVEVARKLGIPSVYEVRGLWEITRISREPHWRNTQDYEFMSQMEAEAAKGADLVLALTRALRDEMIDRGVDASKIHLAPNGVDPERFRPRAPNFDLKRKLGLEGHLIVGYVGSILDYEGIDLLIRTAENLRESIKRVTILIVGDGAFLEDAKALAADLKVNDVVRFVGRVPFEEVEDYYSIMDICPLPRHPLPVCEMVSPLKPFEAMAMGKVVVGSDVDAIAEIIVPGVNGMLCRKGSYMDLSERIIELARDNEMRNALGRSAREWVSANRSWRSISKGILQAYESAGFLKTAG